MPPFDRSLFPVTTPWANRLLFITYLLLPTLLLLAPLAAAPWLMLLAAGLLLPWLWVHRRTEAVRTLGRDPIVLAALALAVWGSLTLLWSPHPLQGATLLPRVVLVMIAGAVMFRLIAQPPDSLRDAVRRGLILGMVLAGAWLLLDLVLLDLTLTRWLSGREIGVENVPKRGLTVLAVMVWPAALMIGRGRPWAGVLMLAGTAALTFASQAGAAKFALIAGTATFALAWLAPRRITQITALLLAACLLTLPYLMTEAIDALDLIARTDGSVQHRFVVWTFVAENAQTKLFEGWGFNMARSIPGGNVIDPLTGGEFIPLHPHNAPLQWWLELGLPGALIGLFLVLTVLRRILALADEDRNRTATALATTAAAIAVSLVGYGAWQIWWLSALVLAAGAVSATTCKATLPQPARTGTTTPHKE